MEMLLITAAGQFKEVEISGNKPVYKSVKEHIGGWMEIVHPKRLPAPYVMLIDDEGLLKERPINQAGSFLYETDKHGSPIVGDIIICREGWTNDGMDLMGLEQGDMKKLFELLTFADSWR
jgi:hypothetical protein